MHPMRLLLALALVGLASPAAAADPPSGTVDPGSPVFVYTGGPYTSANASNNVSLDGEPICDPNGSTCDDFMLTVDVPANYQADNPTHRVVIHIAWPNSTDDFDLYVQDPNTGTSVDSSPTGANPEVVVLPAVAGTYRVRNLAYLTVNATLTGTITLGEPPVVNDFNDGVYVPSQDVFACNTHLTGEAETSEGILFDHSQDGEPSVKVTPHGVDYISAIAGLGGGSGLWRMTDPCGQEFSFLGIPDGGVGGGDSDVEIGLEPNALGFYNVYTSSLTLANITTTTSLDGGDTHLFSPIADVTPVNDRQWNAAYGADTVYLSYRSLNFGNELFVVRSDAGGAPGTYVGPFLVYSDVVVDAALATQLGNMVTDGRPVPAGTPLLQAGADGEGNVYHGWVLTGTKVYVSVSRDFGVTWSSKLVYEGSDPTKSYDHIFTWVTVDQAGNVYTCFSDNNDIYYSASTDQGDTWSTPVRVSVHPLSKSSIFPVMAGGSDGHIALSWYGSPTASPADNASQWRVFHARVPDALDPEPEIELQVVSDHVIRHGFVCQGGLSCNDGRQLVDCFDMAIDPIDGSSIIAYTDDALTGGTYVVKQVAGSSAIAGRSVVDRTAVCPTLANDCTSGPPDPEDPCERPGVTIAEDPPGDVSAAGNTQHDIRQLWFAEPYMGAGYEKLHVTLEVAELNAATLPPNSIWRVEWTNPSDGEVYFVTMETCDQTSSPSYSWGFVDANGIYASQGDADDGSFDELTGRIEIVISKALVGNPQPGATLSGAQAGTNVLAGALCSGLSTQVDATASGSYTLVGNLAGCGPVPVVTVSPIQARPLAEPGQLELQWTAEYTDGMAGWHVYRSRNRSTVEERLTTQPLPATDGVATRFVDGTAGSGIVHYRLAGVMPGGQEETLARHTVELAAAPSRAFLRVSGSNPFRDATQLSFATTQAGPVSVEVYNLAGQHVRTLLREELLPGVHQVAFDARDGKGARLGAGVYLVRLRAGNRELTTRITHLD